MELVSQAVPYPGVVHPGMRKTDAMRTTKIALVALMLLGSTALVGGLLLLFF